MKLLEMVLEGQGSVVVTGGRSQRMDPRKMWSFDGVSNISYPLFTFKKCQEL